MRTTGYRNFNVGKPVDDGAMLRYLRGKDQGLINEDDPGFFAFQAAREDTLSALTFPHPKRKKASGRSSGRGSFLQAV